MYPVGLCDVVTVREVGILFPSAVLHIWHNVGVDRATVDSYSTLRDIQLKEGQASEFPALHTQGCAVEWPDTRSSLTRPNPEA